MQPTEEGIGLVALSNRVGTVPVASQCQLHGALQVAPSLPCCPSPRSQFARRALAAAIAPGMAMRPVAEVAGVRVLDDEVDEPFAAKARRQLPRSGLVEEHQRRFDRHWPVEPKRQRLGKSLHGIVPAIGIAREIRFAHAADERVDTSPVGERGCVGEKQQIARRHECRRQTRRRERNLGFSRQGCIADDFSGQRVRVRCRDRGAAQFHLILRASRRITARCSISTICRWPYVKPTVSTCSYRSSAHARHTVESCPPEKSTRADDDATGYRLFPSNNLGWSEAASTPSRQRTFTATIGLPLGCSPCAKEATPHVAQNG